MPPESAVAIAAVFTWLGMVVAISFIEAPLKFRAPGVTVPVGLGIGRIGLAAVLIGSVLISGDTGPAAIAGAATVAILTTQLVVVRPRLNRRSDRVLAGEKLPRSRGHLWYVGLEALKLPGLITTGVLLLIG